MSVIIHKAGVVARSNPRAYRTLNHADLPTWIDYFMGYLKNVGWRETALHTMESSSQQTWYREGIAYKQAVSFYFETSGNTLKFYVSDAFQTASSVEPIYFEFSPLTTWLFLTSEYQFALIKLEGPGTDLFISSLKIPTFMRNNPWVNSIVATNGDLLRSFRASGFGARTWTAMVPTSGSVQHWQGSGNGSPLFFPMRTDDVFAQARNVPLVHPAFIGWGDDPASQPFMRGFGWNMLFKYGTYSLLNNLKINRHEYIALSSLFNISLLWEVS